jgi:3-dehydroquinate synthase
VAATSGGATPLRQPNIVLVGFMGSGKSEVGRHLAEKTGRQLIDVDSIVQENGATIPEIFAAEGEVGFRRRERTAVEKVARSKGTVIATGGGSVLDAANVKALKRSGVLVYLNTSVDELVRRLEKATDRPLLRGTEGAVSPAAFRRRVEGLLDARRPVYESVADHVVRCDGRGPGEVAADIVRRLQGDHATAKMRRVKVETDPAYSVCIGHGLLARAAEIVKLPRTTENAFVVSHPRIRKLWGEPLEVGLAKAGLSVTWSTFPEGEERKSLDTAARLARTMARADFHRGDVVFALGGGVVTDVGGFVASTYARGVQCVHLPTTLLGMVDAAIGGKTGVNLPQGKNLVGTFHQPLGVLADLDVLGTLPERELRGGLAEVIKYGFISDPSLVDLVGKKRDEIFARGDILEKIVMRCAKIKAGVVATDEKEEGLRAILNYGHTLGHAIEALSIGGTVGGRTKGAKLHHGEAISIGMVYAAAVSQIVARTKEDLVEDHRRVLESVGLPTRVDGVTWSEVRDRMQLDKKYASGMRLVLLTRAGEPVVERVSEKILERAFAEVAG